MGQIAGSNYIVLVKQYSIILRIDFSSQGGSRVLIPGKVSERGDELVELHRVYPNSTPHGPHFIDFTFMETIMFYEF